MGSEAAAGETEARSRRRLLLRFAASQSILGARMWRCGCSSEDPRAAGSLPKGTQEVPRGLGAVIVSMRMWARSQSVPQRWHCPGPPHPWGLDVSPGPSCAFSTVCTAAHARHPQLLSSQPASPGLLPNMRSPRQKVAIYDMLQKKNKLKKKTTQPSRAVRKKESEGSGMEAGWPPGPIAPTLQGGGGDHGHTEPMAQLYPSHRKGNGAKSHSTSAHRATSPRRVQATAIPALPSPLGLTQGHAGPSHGCSSPSVGAEPRHGEAEVGTAVAEPRARADAA